jgi:hypothetical protein
MSVDVELVTFGVFHRDCVMVDAFLLDDADDRGPEGGQAPGLGVDALLAGLDRKRAPVAAGGESRCSRFFSGPG